MSLSKTAVQAGAQVWRRGPGDPRPTAEIVALFKGRIVTHVSIRDPYALASAANRRAQAAFLGELALACRSIEAVTIEYIDVDTGDLTDGDARADMRKRLRDSFPQAQPRIALAPRARGYGARDFHDRIVDIDVRHAGGAVQRHALFFGRGAEALYDTRRECNVTYAPAGHA